ncbi:MAG: prepilin-type N-terminal cleavage/methylation domain-containing protein [Akkermansiaceae bacterium]|nr:prepilin-type N-terminal cleavage/methylation domain-containing protein [Akkermansiaceae bacterium]
MILKLNDSRRVVVYRGFTLIELLVVIAIVAVLAALIFSVSLRVINNGRSAKDLAQLRQSGIGITAHASETGRYPLSQQATKGGYFWMDHIRASAGMHSEGSDTFTHADAEPFMSKRLNVRIPSDLGSGGLRALKHYACVEAVMPWREDAKGYPGVPFVALKRPSTTAMLIDAPAQNPESVVKSSHINLWGGAFRSQWFYRAAWPQADNPAKEDEEIAPEACEAVIDFRHNGKAHVLFADGHVESLKSNEFRYSMFTNAY